MPAGGGLYRDGGLFAFARVMPDGEKIFENFSQQRRHTMTARVLYTQNGTDPSTITWPDVGPVRERWTFTSGTPVVINDLIGYGRDGSITFGDGRAFPSKTPQGSTFVHQRTW
jgi:hypothetical protein